MDFLPVTSHGSYLQAVRMSEIGTISIKSLSFYTHVKLERQKWISDPRDLAGGPLYQQPLVCGNDIIWDHEDYRYQWENDKGPVARPLTSGGLVFNYRTEWWERNGSSWQPEKKTKGGRQTIVELRHLGVVVRPTVSRLFDKAKELLWPKETIQEKAKSLTGALKGVPTVIAEVSDLKRAAAEANIDPEAKIHVLYSPIQPYRISNSLSRKSCRHPSTCTLHPHINVDVPQNISIPFAEEPEKMEAHESGFLQRSCHHEGHAHLSHEEDPCFSDTKLVGKAIQLREDAIEQVMEFAATGAEADELESIWQQEEERERRQEMLMSYSPVKENRPPSISAHTLFHDAAKNLQKMSQESLEKSSLRGGEQLSLLSRAATSLRLRGGARQRCPGFPLSWRIKECFSPTRMKPVLIGRTDSSDEEFSGRTRRRRIHHRVSNGREFGFSPDQWANLRELEFEKHSSGGHSRTKTVRNRNGNWVECDAVGTVNKSSLGGIRSQGRIRTVSDEDGNLVECEVVGSVKNRRRRRHRSSDSDSDSSDGVDTRRSVRIASWATQVSNRPQYTSRSGGRGQRSSHYSPHVGDDPRTQTEYLAWHQYGRPTHQGANLVARAPAGASRDEAPPPHTQRYSHSSRCDDLQPGEYDVESRAPGGW